METEGTSGTPSPASSAMAGPTSTKLTLTSVSFNE
jgi:hypothetical protein